MKPAAQLGSFQRVLVHVAAALGGVFCHAGAWDKIVYGAFPRRLVGT